MYTAAQPDKGLVKLIISARSARDLQGLLAAVACCNLQWHCAAHAAARCPAAISHGRFRDVWLESRKAASQKPQANNDWRDLGTVLL